MTLYYDDNYHLIIEVLVETDTSTLARYVKTQTPTTFPVKLSRDYRKWNLTLINSEEELKTWCKNSCGTIAVEFGFPKEAGYAIYEGTIKHQTKDWEITEFKNWLTELQILYENRSKYKVSIGDLYSNCLTLVTELSHLNLQIKNYE
jgi:hypothetical protein